MAMMTDEEFERQRAASNAALEAAQTRMGEVANRRAFGNAEFDAAKKARAEQSRSFDAIRESNQPMMNQLETDARDIWRQQEEQQAARAQVAEAPAGQASPGAVSFGGQTRVFTPEQMASGEVAQWKTDVISGNAAARGAAAVSRDDLVLQGRAEGPLTAAQAEAVSPVTRGGFARAGAREANQARAAKTTPAAQPLSARHENIRKWYEDQGIIEKRGSGEGPTREFADEPDYFNDAAAAVTGIKDPAALKVKMRRLQRSNNTADKRELARIRSQERQLRASAGRAKAKTAADAAAAREEARKERELKVKEKGAATKAQEAENQKAYNEGRLRIDDATLAQRKKEWTEKPDRFNKEQEKMLEKQEALAVKEGDIKRAENLRQEREKAKAAKDLHKRQLEQIAARGDQTARGALITDATTTLADLAKDRAEILPKLAAGNPEAKAQAQAQLEQIDAEMAKARDDLQRYAQPQFVPEGAAPEPATESVDDIYTSGTRTDVSVEQSDISMSVTPSQMKRLDANGDNIIQNEEYQSLRRRRNDVVRSLAKGHVIMNGQPVLDKNGQQIPLDIDDPNSKYRGLRKRLQNELGQVDFVVKAINNDPTKEG